MPSRSIDEGRVSADIGGSRVVRSKFKAGDNITLTDLLTGASPEDAVEIKATGGAHNLLSSTHEDTDPASVVRGDLMVGNATPKWARLALAAAGKVPRSDGTDFKYSTFTIPDSFALGGILYISATDTLTRSAPSAANQVLRSTGADALEFGALVAADIPDLGAGKITTGTMATARLGSGTADSTTFLRGDQSWAVPAGGSNSKIVADGATSSLTGSTVETTLKSVAITGGTISANGLVKIRLFHKNTGGNGTKTLRIKLGTTTILDVAYGAGDANFWEIEIFFMNANAQNSQRWWGNITAHPAAGTGTQAFTNNQMHNTSAEDTSADRTLAFTFQLASGLDSVDVYGWFVELFK